MIVSNHLKRSESISDAIITDVIDEDSPPLLVEIRKKLNLEPGAFLIPADVHDHLIDAGILSPSMLVGTRGGNILDEKHVGGFLRVLDEGSNGDCVTRKTGATFLFHHHQVSILKHFLGEGKVMYDLIESLPYSGDMLASRIKCEDSSSIAVALRWHAFQKLLPTDLGETAEEDDDDELDETETALVQEALDLVDHYGGEIQPQYVQTHLKMRHGEESEQNKEKIKKAVEKRRINWKSRMKRMVIG